MFDFAGSCSECLGATDKKKFLDDAEQPLWQKVTCLV